MGFLQGRTYYDQSSATFLKLKIHRTVTIHFYSRHPQRANHYFDEYISIQLCFQPPTPSPPPPPKKQNKTKQNWNRWHCSLKLGSYFVKSHYATLILLHIISLICAQRFSASSFYRTNLVEVANVGRMTQNLPVKSETGQEIRRRTSDILPVQEHQRFIGAYIEVSRLRDPPGH